MNTVNITSGFIAVIHGFITAISVPTAVIPATSARHSREGGNPPRQWISA